MISGERHDTFDGLSIMKEKLQRALIIADSDLDHIGYCPNPRVDDIYSISDYDYLSRVNWYVSDEYVTCIKKAEVLGSANSEGRAFVEPGDYLKQPYYEKFNLPRSENWGWHWGSGGWLCNFCS